MPTADGADASALPPKLTRLAMEALEAPELHEKPLPSGFATLMRLWHYEDAGQWRAWSISRRSSAIDASVLLVRKVLWDRPAEFARIAGPRAPAALPPLLSLFEARFPVESWNSLLQEVTALRVLPLLPGREIPSGGARERFGLAYRLPTQTVSFEWWGTPPAEWRELAEWSSRALGAMEAWLQR